MTIALCDPGPMVGKTVARVVNYWDVLGTQYGILFTDGSVFSMKLYTENRNAHTFFYGGKDQYDAAPAQLMKVMGCVAADLDLVTTEQWEDYKAAEREKKRQASEELDRREYERLKERFEPKAKKEE